MTGQLHLLVSTETEQPGTTSRNQEPVTQLESSISQSTDMRVGLLASLLESAGKDIALPINLFHQSCLASS